MEEITYDQQQCYRLRRELLKHLHNNGYFEEIKRACRFFAKSLTDGTAEYPMCRIVLNFDVIVMRNECDILAEVLISEPIMWRTMLEEIVFRYLKSYVKAVHAIERTQIQTPIRIKGVWNPVQINRRHGGIQTTTGILVNVDHPQKYIMQSVWKCDEECNGAIVEIGLPLCAPRCESCNSVTIEQASCRLTGEMTNVYLVESSAADIPNIIRISVKDELMESITAIGGVYAVNSVSGQAWGVERVRPETRLIPRDVKASRNLDWLIGKLGGGWLPGDAMKDLKEGIVLSLASLQESIYDDNEDEKRDESPLHILALGSEYMIAWRLMVEALAWVPRWSLMGTIHLLLPTDLTNASLMQTLTSDLESGRFKGIVWAAGPNMGKSSLPKQIWALINVFGMSFGAEMDEASSKQFMDDALKESMGCRSRDSIISERTKMQDQQKIKRIFHDISNHPTKMDVNSVKLLKDYFLAVRGDRPSLVPLKTLNILCNLWRSRSRLSQQASSSLALHAVRLHASVTGFFDNQSQLNEDIDFNVQCAEGDMEMAQFETWLKEYLLTMLGPDGKQNF